MGRIVLTADVGGTNTSIALIERSAETFPQNIPAQVHTPAPPASNPYRILALEMYRSQELRSFSHGLRQALAAFAPIAERERISASCLAVAGPVKDNSSDPSNIAWSLSGEEIAQDFGFPTLVINDFTALCYGVSLLDISDPSKITPLPQPSNHSSGRIPPQQKNVNNIGVRLVVGAGTGLGTGVLIEDALGAVFALPAEGGHADCAPYNTELCSLVHYIGTNIQANADYPLNVEGLVSGQGIVNIFRYYSDVQGSNEESETSIIQKINALPPAERAAAISRYATQSSMCRQTMSTFVEAYARLAHNCALGIIPKQGLYLAGGIAAKNKRFFLENNRFMEAFLYNGTASIRPLLRDIPVYIVEDYQTSLYGAAHALTMSQ